MPAEILYPDYLKQKSWWSKYRYYFIILGLIILLVFFSYFLYQKYYSPVYELTGLLPQKYDIAFTFKNDYTLFSKNQRQQLLNNPGLNNVYQAGNKIITDFLNKLPADEQLIIKKFSQGIVFFQNPENYGIILALANKKETEKIGELKLTDLYQQIIKQNILVISNNQELLNQMTGKSPSRSSYFLSIEFSPWLTTYIQNSFFEATYQNLLGDLQTILKPLQMTNSQNFTLKTFSKPHQLSLELKPLQTPPTAAENLDDFLKFLPKEYDLIFGISDPTVLIEQLKTNASLNNYFKQADALIWSELQISLKEAIGELTGPIIVAVQGSDWQLLTNRNNQQIIDGYLKNYLAQFNPVKRTITLPDKSQAVELITDPSTVVWENVEDDGWQIFKSSIPETSEKIGYALKDNALLLGNKMGDIKEMDWENQDNLTEISSIFTFYPQKQKIFNTSLFIKDFSKITAVSLINDEIKLLFFY
ncbi:hypothetical protein KKF32_04615 [Patescibacteria group bacterium]|nr:hypothetical protein [Patescibacteria group bacterium]